MKSARWTGSFLLITAVVALGCATETTAAAGERTVEEIRSLGTLLMENALMKNAEPSSRTGQASPHPATTDSHNEASMTGALSAVRLGEGDLRRLLPGVDIALGKDTWGQPLEVWLGRREGSQRLLIRSLGQDGVAQSDLLTSEWPRPEGASAGKGDDIVWVDGYFISWPK